MDRLRGSDEDRFARQVLRAIKEGGAAEAWYEPDQFAILYRREGTEAKPAVAYLGNLYRECAGGDRAYRDQQIARYVRAVVLHPKLPETWDTVAPLLRPVMRPVGFGNNPHGPGMVPVSRPVLPYVREYVVIDQPDSMAYLTAMRLDSLGVGAEVVFDTARENLLRQHGMPGTQPGETGPALIRLVEDGTAYWSSCLLLDGWLAAFADRVGGRPVAFMADNSGVLITSDQADALRAVYKLVEEEYREASRPLSPQGYTVDGAGRLVPYAVPDGHPVAPAVHRASCILAATAYLQQRGELGARYGDRMFVAELLLAERPDGSMFSVATWSHDVDTLLPRADFVGFSSDSERFFVPWDVVADEAAPLLAEEGVAPDRYRVRSWPPPATMDSLRAAAVNP
jgi:hypothetical protein